MGKKIDISEQAAELCMQIRQAVESWWLYDALGNYVVVRNGKERARPFARAYFAIWNSAFDSVIVCAHNLVVTPKTDKPLTFETFADDLAANGQGALLAVRLRAMRKKHSRFVESLIRIRNKTTAHVDRSMTTERQFNAAQLGTADIRNFLQDLVYLFHAISKFSSKDIGPPDKAVYHQMEQMLHLAIQRKEQFRVEGVT